MAGNVKVVNLRGEAGAVVQDGAGAVTADADKSFNYFRFVTSTILSSITTSKVTNAADLQGETFAAGQDLILPGVTAFTVTSGIVIAYYKVGSI